MYKNISSFYSCKDLQRTSTQVTWQNRQPVKELHFTFTSPRDPVKCYCTYQERRAENKKTDEVLIMKIFNDLTNLSQMVHESVILFIHASFGDYPKRGS